MISGKVAGLFQERQDGKIQVRIEPGSIVSQEPQRQPGDISAREASQESATVKLPVPGEPPIFSQSREVQRFQIPLLEGKLAVVELPHGWTEADITKMLQIMKVMFLWDKEK